MAAAYAVVGFVMVQAADLLLPALNLPSWTYSFFVALVLLGFPVAVALAWAFDITPDGLKRTAAAPGADPDASGGEAAVGRRIQRAGVRRAAWFSAGILVALTGAWYLVARGGGEPAAPALDTGLVAVFPFRVAGADPSLGYLGEGMVELLSIKLNGTGGPRAVDPQTAIRAAQRAGGADVPVRAVALSLARSLGAGYAVTGAVVGTPANVTLSGALLDAATGREIATASVSDAPDALPRLVDRLAAALLSLSAGEAEERLPSLTATPLPALQAYLEGQAAVRRGEFAEAGRHFDRAIERDSTFALAALRKAIAVQWLNDPAWWDALRYAWERRDRLSRRDRLLLEAWGGPDFPEWSRMADWIAVIERVALAMPDRAETWYWLGDRLYHQGDWVGWPDAYEQAVQHFRRAVDMDSTLLEPLIHLTEIAIVEGDAAAVRRYSSLYFRADSVSETAIGLRWEVAAALGDTAVQHELRSGLERIPARTLRSLLQSAIVPGGPLEDAEAISAELRRRAGTRAERAAALGAISWYELHRGWPARAAATIAERGELLGEPTASIDVIRALYFEGDQDAGARGAQWLERRVRGELAAGTAAARERARELCALGQWQVWRGESNAGASTTRALRELLPALEASSDGFEEDLDSCVRVLQAVLPVVRGDPEAAEAVEALEAYFRAGPMLAGFRLESAPILATLWETLGDPERALAAIRLRTNRYSVFLPPVLAFEARLAAAAGERDTAIRLYEHYLRVRSEPEPSRVPQAARARAELSALLAETP